MDAEQTATFPTITKDIIDSRIAEVSYSRPFFNVPHLTICGIRMKNGFLFLGKSAPVSPGNFDQAVGEKLAYEDAYRQIWSHEGYVLANIVTEQRSVAL